MALNFSHRPIFPTHLPEDSLVSPMRIANGYLVDDVPEKNGDGFSKSWHSNSEIDGCFDYARDRNDMCVSQEPVSKDILDLLPSDPFGMDMSTTFTAITGWLEDLEVDYGGYRSNEFSSGDGNYQLFAGLNFIWNNAMRLQAFPGSMRFDQNLNVSGAFDAGCSGEKWVMGCGLYNDGPGSDCNLDNILSLSNEKMGVRNLGFDSNVASGFGGAPPDEMKAVEHELCPGRLGSVCDVDGILSFGNERMDIACQQSEGFIEDGGPSSNEEAGVPHAAMGFALGYLGVRDLLLVERVCRSLHSAVQSDPLLWRSIHIEPPLHEKITDDVLLQLTNRAQGNLQCLSLEDCTRITDDGLKRVLDNNPRLSQLSVPGCTRLSIEGIVNNLKAFKSMGTQGVKFLRIGGLFGVTLAHFEELKFLLGIDSHMPQNTHKPHFFSRANAYLSLEDDRAIDIEMCPRCRNLRLVYDCPTESCQGKEHDTQVCRACTICIARCFECGRCVNDNEYEETFCLEWVCSDCWKQQSKCQERQERKLGPLKPSSLHEPNCMECHLG